jgi:hypothetical protein
MSRKEGLRAAAPDPHEREFPEPVSARARTRLLRRPGLRLALPALALALALTAAACGSSSSSAAKTSTTSSKQAVCSAEANLKQSMSDLADPSVLTGGTTSIKSAVQKVQDDLDALSTAAKGNYKPEVDALKSSLDQLKTTIGNLGNGSVSSSITQIGDDISNVGSAASALQKSVTTKCP